MNPKTIDKNIVIRDRDIYWWGKLPIGWRVKKLKYISLIQLSNVDKLSVEGQEIVFLCNYTDVYKNEKIVSTLPFMQATATDEQIKRLSIQKSDVLLTKDSETPDDIGIPAIVAEEITGVVCGYHLALSRPNPDIVHSGFLFRAIQSQPIKRYFYVNSVGMTRYGLDKQAIAEIPIPLPSLSIQKAIAEYLDREIAHIDALIDAKQRLIELLVEKRQALISHSVTHGVNPDTPFLNTGISWLGEIPKHWELEFARWLFDDIDERSETGDEELLSVSHLTGVTPRSEKDVNMFMAETNEGYKICQPGDLVINTLWAWMGAMGVAFQHGLVSPAYNVYRPTGQYNPRYLDFLVRVPNFAKEATRYSKGVWSSRLRLYPEEFFLIQMPVPPLDEQQEIVDYLDGEISKIDRLSQATQSSIALLSERRTALISAAVTGQIEIPEASCN